MKKIGTFNGFEVVAYGSEIDSSMQAGSRVAVPASMQRRLEASQQARRQGDNFERVYETGITIPYGGTYDSSSLADFFQVDRRPGWATSIRMNMVQQLAPRMASVVCCSTDVPIISIERTRRHLYAGFVNLAIATDVCVFDELQAADAGVNMDDEYLPAINAALVAASNYIAIHGDAEHTVYGLKNNPYISTVSIDPINVTNPIISFRRLTQFLELRDTSIINLSGLLTKTFTMFVPYRIITSLANTWITLGNAQVSLLSILTKNCGICANDPAVPAFRLVGMRDLERSWWDGQTDVAYIFTSDASGLGDSITWYKPFSLINLGADRHGLRKFQYFGARCGSVMPRNLNKMLRILIPQNT